mgnify:CR=1 FL=1
MRTYRKISSLVLVCTALFFAAGCGHCQLLLAQNRVDRHRLLRSAKHSDLMLVHRTVVERDRRKRDCDVGVGAIDLRHQVPVHVLERGPLHHACPVLSW